MQCCSHANYGCEYKGLQADYEFSKLHKAIRLFILFQQHCYMFPEHGFSLSNIGKQFYSNLYEIEVVSSKAVPLADVYEESYCFYIWEQTIDMALMVSA